MIVNDSYDVWFYIHYACSQHVHEQLGYYEAITTDLASLDTVFISILQHRNLLMPSYS